MNQLCNFRSILLFNEVRESHLHHADTATYKDRNIDGTRPWPLLPKFSYVRVDWNLMIELRTCL